MTRRTVPARGPVLRAGACFVLAMAPCVANAAWECSDGHGLRYVVGQLLEDGPAGVQCSAIADPPGVAAPAGVLPAADAPESPRWELLAPGTAKGRGMLVLLPASGSSTHGASAYGRAANFDQFIDAAANAYGHDADLLRAIIQVESGFDAKAVSSKGAIGLMQVMPATAARLGLADPDRALFDPEANVRTGARYLRQLMDTFDGRPDLAVAAYNAGEGAVQRYAGRVPPFPETQAYVRDVMTAYERLRRSH